jgi:hypothetical protein
VVEAPRNYYESLSNAFFLNGTGVPDAISFAGPASSRVNPLPQGAWSASG